MSFYDKNFEIISCPTSLGNPLNKGHDIENSVVISITLEEDRIILA
jgi:hypothetical protein